MSSLTEAVGAFSALQVARPKLALATLVAVHGPAAAQPGARMWLTADGRLGGAVTLGGCADARILEALREALAGAPAGLLSASLGEAEAYAFGMSCSGQVEVWVEAVDLGDPADAAIWGALSAALQEEQRAVLVTNLTTGARWVVGHDGLLSGASSVPAAYERAVLAALAEPEPRSRLETHATGAVFTEPLTPRPRLIVVGAGPVAVYMTTFARSLGYRTMVVDARADLLTPERFPLADELRLGVPDEVFDFATCSPATAVVVTAHNYAYEVPVLRAALHSRAGYVGMVASRRRGRAILDFLVQTGVSPEQVGRVRTRAGLDIRAVSPAEIALSILGEVVSRRRGGTGLALTDLDVRERDGRELTSV